VTAPDLTGDEALVARLLAPLAMLEPAHWPGPPRTPGPFPRAWLPRRSRPRIRRLAMVACVLAGGAVGSAGYALETWVTRPAEPSPISPGGPLSCLPILGRPGQEAAALLAADRISVSWRFTRYADPDSGASLTTAPSAPPLPSVVEGVEANPDGGVIVFLRALADPFAPPLASHLPGCPDTPHS